MKLHCAGPAPRRAVSPFARLTLLVAALAVVSASWACLPAHACEGQPGRGPFTIQGEVVDANGRPVAGLTLKWLPVLPGRALPDWDNLFYSVKGRPEAKAVTDEGGRFELASVQDYFDVESHQYVVWGTDLLASPPKNAYWRVTGGEVSLVHTPPKTVSVQLTAEPAGAVRVRVLKRDGTPFEGNLPVAFARAGDEGNSLALTCAFFKGEYLQGGLEPGLTRVSILAGRSAEEIKFRNYVAYYEQKNPAPVVPVRAQDVLLRTELTVVANTERDVTFTLP